MNSSYIKAVETRNRWLRFTENNWDALFQLSPAVEAYDRVLKTSDIFFMNQKFCSLVDHARRSVPDNMKFDPSWLLSKRGFIYIEEPFVCPFFVPENSRLNAHMKIKHGFVVERDGKVGLQMKIRAVGWLPVSSIVKADGKIAGKFDGDETTGGTAFLMYHDLGSGYGMWSYFNIEKEEVLIDRIQSFEESAKRTSGEYAVSREINEVEEMHEIRWVYAALYLMQQRVAVQVTAQADRASRKRAAHIGYSIPDQIKIISLRKLEAARAAHGPEGPKNVDWHWQWEVRGHWRNQWYAAAQEHRPVFVEAYIKGPDDKPLKAGGEKLFAAVR